MSDQEPESPSATPPDARPELQASAPTPTPPASEMSPAGYPPMPISATTRIEDATPKSGEDLFRILLMFWRYKFLIGGLCLAGAAAGFLLAQRARPVYQSEATLRVVYHAPSSLTNSWDSGPSDSAYERFFNSIIEEATSRNVMMRAADKVLARQDVPSVQGADRDTIIDYLTKGAAVTPDPKSNHVTYVFNTEYQNEAPIVLAYLVQAFKEEQRQSEGGQYSQLTSNVQNDAANRKAEFDAANKAYLDFKIANNIDDVDSIRASYAAQLLDMKTQLAKCANDILVKQSMLSVVDDKNDQSVLDWAKAQLDPNYLLQEQQRNYDDLHQQYSDLLKIYNTKQKDVIRVGQQMVAVRQEMINLARGRYQQAKTDLAASVALQAKLQGDLDALNKAIADQAPILDRCTVLKDQEEIARTNWENFLKDSSSVGSQTFPVYTEISTVELPSDPKQVYPRLVVFIPGGAILGIMIACLIVMLWSRIDDTFKTSNQVPKELGIPNLGTVLFSSAIGPDPSGLPLVSRMPRSPEAEALFIVWANIASQLNLQPGTCKVLMLSSSIPEEGKSTASVNLAAVAAQQNLRVLLVDLDLRRPSLHNYFGITNALGCIQALNRQMRREQCIQRTAVKNLDIMTTGMGDDHPNELVSPANLMGLIAWARANYDLVVIDTPPLLLAADGLIVSRYIDGAALVIHGGHTPLDTVTRSRDMLLSAHAKLLGAVLNDRTGAVDERDRAYYYKYSAYYAPKAVNE
ncbi:MAG: GumC family protein [Planctomycetota bacterium]